MIALLGTNQALALEELRVVLMRLQSDAQLRLIGNQLVEISEITLDPISLLKELGGTVKLLEPLPEGDVTQVIVDDLSESQDGRVRYCISSFSSESVEPLSIDVKKLLAQKSIPARYRLPESPRSSAGLGDQWHDYILYEHDTCVSVAKTVAVQEIDRWAWKDRGRPWVDPRSGMLPPKIARIMINLGLGSNSINRGKSIVLDPFCGSGTILTEGLDMGLCMYGSDVSSLAVEQSRANCSWFQAEDPAFYAARWRVDHRDVMDISIDTYRNVSSLVAIVFEGYLGPPHMPENKVKNMHKGLRKLYIGALKRLRPLLQPGNRIVCALPLYVTDEGVKSFDDLIDSCEKYGYTSPVEPFVYGRASAKVKRSIYVFEAR